MIRPVILLILFASLVLSGCNTLSGFGRDLQQGGQWIERRATPQHTP